jgi:protein-S-isoprenylcysteine O-methyltransferase Ste14
MIDFLLIHFSILFYVLALNLIALVLTLCLKNVQVWPPPSKRSWQFWFTWISVLGILDQGTLGLNHYPRFIIAGILILISVPIGLSAIHQLSFKQTLGLEGKFITTGIYRYTRNPQYVTHILLIAAVVLVANSALALQVGIPYALWFMLAPFSEETWLIKQIMTG